MVELERRGIPTVIFTAEAFVHDARRSAQSFGLAGLPLAIVSTPLTNRRPEDIHRMAAEAFEQVVAGLTRPVEGCGDVGRPAVEERLTYDGPDLLEAWSRMNRDFLARGWSDGFPLVAPTGRAVEAMLRGSARDPGEVIATLEPGFGVATVEKLAINAVMAGGGRSTCRSSSPRSAASRSRRCTCETRRCRRGPTPRSSSSTGRRGGRRTSTPGCARSGRAPRRRPTPSSAGRSGLTMMNVGHTYVGVSDMDTIGSPLKYSLACAENEAQSPWEPYHVTRGYAREVSTVTVHFVYGICELHDFRSTRPEDLIQVFATAATNVAQVGTALWLIGRRADPRYKTEEREHNTLFVCPEHAQIFAGEGWDRARIQQALYKTARLPFRTLMLNKEPKALQTAHPELGWLADHPDLPLPVVEAPDCFEIAVVGGAAGRGAYFYGAGEPVTMPVED